MSDITEELLEEAFLKEKVNMDFDNGGTNTKIESNEGGILVTKTTNVDDFLKQAQLERESFAMTSNTQDHMKKVASIPTALYYMLMDECDRLNITSKKERNAYLIHKLQTNEFEAFLSVPKGMIRKVR